ncbi:MAG: glycosyltransferase family 4 protein [Algicola sp.]|nr:glycosyltransferase family 4 protein [Algicola sp.]
MNLLVLSNMKPSKVHVAYGLFVQNQVDVLNKMDEIDHLLYLGITSVDKSFAGLLKKYLLLLIQLFTQAIFTRKKFDIIHVHYYFPTILYALVYKFLRNPKTKIVVTLHGGDVSKYRNLSWIYRAPNRFVDHHIFVSEGLRNGFFANPSSYTVLSAGILDSFELERPQVSEKVFDLLMVGRLVINKGTDRLMALLEKLEGELTVGVIGDGVEARAIEQFQSDRHKLVRLGLCPPEQMKQYFYQSKFVISLSRLESFGLVMSEAMACGVPVIATKSVGAFIQVQDDYNGFLLENSEEEFVQDNVQKVQKCLDLYGTPAYQEVVDNAAGSNGCFKLGHIIIEVVSIYQKLLARDETRDLPG